MNDKKNGLPGSVSFGGVAERSHNRDYENLVDGCINDPKRFEILLANCTCRKTLDYARQKIEGMRDPEKKRMFIKMIKN